MLLTIMETLFCDYAQGTSCPGCMGRGGWGGGGGGVACLGFPPMDSGLKLEPH